MILPPRVLIVDAEFESRLLLGRWLNAGGFAPTAAHDVSEALRQLRAGRFDLVLLTLRPPAVDGGEWCRQIREFSDVPLLLLGEAAEARDLVRSLALGADGYLLKPLGRDLLLSRIRALLRRCAWSADPPAALTSLTIGPLRLDAVARSGTLGDVDLHLTAREFGLLFALASHPGALLSRRYLSETVWQDDAPEGSKTLDVHVSRLRHKLEVAGGCGSLVLTVRNRGYLLSSALAGVVAPGETA